LTDIGLFGFHGFGKTGSFQWIWILRLMFVEHQSTSGTKISTRCTYCKSSTA